MRTGLVISALLHAGVAAVLLFGPIEIVDRPAPPADLPLEMVFEPPAPVLPDFGDDFAELDAATVEETAPLPAPEPAAALDEPVPDTAPEQEVVEADPIEPIETSPDLAPEEPDEVSVETVATEAESVEPEALAEEPAEATVAVPEIAPLQPPPAEETAEPETQTVTAEPVGPEETQTAEALPPAPLPKRKPAQDLSETEPEPEPAEPAQATPQDVAQADPEPTPSRAAEPEPEPSYRTPTVTGALTPGQLLDNLAALRDEEVQAKNDPELWTVIRAVRAQVARCWLINPAETRNANLSVDIAVAFDKSGKLLKAEVQEVGRMVTDESFKTFAMAAHSALKSCSPFDLPAAQYDLWQRFTMRFVPRKPS